MNPFWLIPIAVLIELPFLLILRASRLESERESARVAAEKIKHVEDTTAVFSILKRANKALRANGAAGSQPYVAACMTRMTKGDDVEISDALTALKMTTGDILRYAPCPEDFGDAAIREQAMKRYDLSYLDVFINELQQLEEGD